MEAGKAERRSVWRDAAFTEMLLMRFAPSLMVVAVVAAYGWRYKAPQVLIPWSIMAASLALAGYRAAKHFQSAQPITFSTSARTPWFTLLATGAVYLLYVLIERTPWVKLAYRVHHRFFSE